MRVGNTLARHGVRSAQSDRRAPRSLAERSRGGGARGRRGAREGNVRSTEAGLGRTAPHRATLRGAITIVCLLLIPLEATGRSPLILTLSSSIDAQRAADAKIVVAIVNRSTASMYVSQIGICYLTSLIVTNAHGVTEPSGDRNPAASTCQSPRTVTVVFFDQIQPGQSYYGYGGNSSGGRLTDWGYHLQPGKYTVQAVLESFSTADVDPGRPHGHPVRWESYPRIESNIVTMSLN